MISCGQISTARVVRVTSYHNYLSIEARLTPFLVIISRAVCISSKSPLSLGHWTMVIQLHDENAISSKIRAYGSLLEIATRKEIKQ